MDLYRIEWNNRLKQDRYGNWKGMVSYILGVDENDCINWLYHKMNKSNVFVKLIEPIHIHGITPYMIDDIITENYEIYKQIDIQKMKDKETTENQMNNLLKQKQAEWYDIDQVINDGNETKKEKEIWNKKKYL